MLPAADYSVDEMKFAYAYHAYLHWQTYRKRASSCLANLDRETANSFAARHSIHILDCQSNSQGVRLLVSLRPGDAISAAASKLKGQAAKWLREKSGERFARGYFACTAGKSPADKVDQYLSSQGQHHGYLRHARPPIFVATFAVDPPDEQRLQPPNAYALVRFHFVLVTWHRHGIFGDASGAEITRLWRSMEQANRFALCKVSFVADHVHLAVRVHPMVAPGTLIVALMNAAQTLIWGKFASDAIQARVERLWQPSAYVGSFGEFATGQLQAYLRRCAEE
ncbi:MAG TPA: IS200/IS605 family transposase [Pirellulales bacterium]|nr:IS200/IS605 family transposase [Pirellulales bacterium]